MRREGGRGEGVGVGTCANVHIEAHLFILNIKCTSHLFQPSTHFVAIVQF